MALANILRTFRAFVDPTRGTTAGTVSEIPPSYAPKYPYNNVIAATGSGHLLEMDDTPGAERIQLTHRSCSHIEIQPDGTTKIVSKNKRQDITMGDHDIIVQGDCNITVDGGTKILVRRGTLEIQAEHGAAINVKGELKMHADNIRMQAINKISLVAPFVDIGGGSGISPYLSLPHGVVPIFGVPVPVMVGLSVPKIAAVPVPSSGIDVAATVSSILSSAVSMAGHLNTIASYAKNIAKSKLLFATMKDASNDPLIPEVDQPEEIPLMNPRLYSGVTRDAIKLRDRQFDSPDDVGDSELYIAHLNISQDLKDFTVAEKDLPGQLISSDTTSPAKEPIPTKAFALKVGTVSCFQGNNTIIGANTAFTEELSVGQSIKIKDHTFLVESIESDTKLIITENWQYPNVTNTVLYIHMLRPFAAFMDKYTYPLTTRLGASNLTLQNMMRNYIPPTIEKDKSLVAIPPIPSDSTFALGGGTINTTTPVAYDNKISETI